MFRHPKDPHALVAAKKPLGNGECAGIVQDPHNGVPGLIPRLIPGSTPERYYPRVADWVRGARVKGNALPRGTVIAIFDSNGCYVGQSKHKYKGLGIAHTALYVGQSEQGIEVVHQFGGTPPKGSLIRFGGGWIKGHRSGVSAVNTSEKGIQPEDDADNYHVVELRPRPRQETIPDASDFTVNISGE